MADIPGHSRREAVLASFRKQVEWCDSLGSPFTAALLAIFEADIAAAGGMTEFIAAWPGDPVADALPLRLAGALHALVLTEQDPALAACYPPMSEPGLEAAVRAAMATHAAFIRDFITSPPQTNEVGRSAVLLGGFLWVAAATTRPLRLLEIGASAGLNFAWDSYRYCLGAFEWGDPASTLLLSPAWDGPSPPSAPVQVATRRACDVAPIDVRDPARRLRLRAYIWADQQDRLSRLDRALEVALACGYRVEQADAMAWSRERLAESSPGCATVFYHSIMWQYMPEASRAAIEDALMQAGQRATDETPLAWLRFEPARADARPELTVMLWPGARQHTLASANAHGSTVTWLHSANLTQ